MQTGIYLDYVRNDITAAALRLAGLLTQRFSRNTDFLTGRVQSPVHRSWDRKVLANRRNDVAGWAKNNDDCVWFNHDAKRFRQAMSANLSRRHILVPKWHALRRADFSWLGIHHMIVCSSAAMLETVRKAMSARNVRCSAYHVHWSSGVRITKKHGCFVPDRMRLMVVVDRFTLQRHCDELVATLGYLLMEVPRLQVTMTVESGWPKSVRAAAKRLLREFEDRFSVTRGMSMDRQLTAINEHDWLWMASVQGTTGFPVQEALSLGVPVIAWDVPPFNEMILNQCNGRLIPAPHTHSDIGAPTAQWLSAAAVTSLLDALRSEEELMACQEQDWALEAKERDFKKFWALLT
jgi:glycosyltransferase involved in cell wall biosynthesis